MTFKLNEIVIFENMNAEILATKSELNNSAEITLSINGQIVRYIKYNGNFDYLIGVDRKSKYDIGNLVFCSESEIQSK